MATDRPLALWIGDAARAEFAPAARQLAACCELACAADPSAAVVLAERLRRPPLLLVVASAWPGQFRDEEITRLWRCWPLARLVSLAGTWCEGEPRSGRPLPGAIRCYWHQWSSRFERDWHAWRSDAAASWSLPVTTGDDDRLLWNDRRWGPPAPECWPAANAAHRVREAHATNASEAAVGGTAVHVVERRAQRTSAPAALPEATVEGGLVVVAARCADSAAWLIGVCRQLGLAAVWQMPHAPLVHSGAVLGIWDLEPTLRPAVDRRTAQTEPTVLEQAGRGQAIPEQAEHAAGDGGDPLVSFCRTMAPARVLALAGFARADDVARLTASGAAAVLSKPLVVADLAWQIERLVCGTAPI